MLVVLLTAGDLLRMRRPLRRIRRPVLAECGDSARQVSGGVWHEVTVSGSGAPASSPSASSGGYGY
jgi:hypothetical protein